MVSYQIHPVGTLKTKNSWNKVRSRTIYILSNKIKDAIGPTLSLKKQK